MTLSISVHASLAALSVCLTVKSVRSGHNGIYADAPTGTNAKLYAEGNPLGEIAFEDKVGVLREIDA